MRAVFDVSGPVDYKPFELNKPDRIVLDIRKEPAGTEFAALEVKGSLTSAPASRARAIRA